MTRILKSITDRVRVLLDTLRMSLQEVKRLSSLTGASMCASLDVLLHLLFTQAISLTQMVRITFVATGLSGLFFGPWLTAMLGIATDLIKYMIRPNGPYFPGFAFNAALDGFLSGAFLYRRPVTPTRVFFLRLTITVVINLGLSSLWLSMMYGKAFIALVSARLLKNLLFLPFETALLYFVLKRAGSIRLSNPTKSV